MRGGVGPKERKDPVRKLMKQLDKAWKDYASITSGYRRGTATKAELAKAFERVKRLERILGVSRKVVMDSVG